MANTDITRRKIKAKISAIKKINDNPNSLVDNTYDAYKDDLTSVNGVVKKSINDFTSKIKGASQNKKDIFGEITDTIEDILGSNKSFDSREKPVIKRRIMKYAKDAAQRALRSSKQIMIDESKKTLFAGVGSCDPNAILNTSSIELSPKNFDFTNALKVDPDSISGRMIYENPNTSNGIKFNTELFNSFDSVTPYDFVGNSTDKLFSMTWNSSTQVYSITGLTPTTKISDFLSDYYNSIEYPDIESVIKNAMLMTFQGDGSEPASFKDGQILFDRLSKKLFSICGNPTSTQPLLNNATDQLTEDETDIQDYFDFDDVEGIDLDDEDAMRRRVLKFRDCNNFELQVNSNHMEDFSYLLDKKTLDENVNNTINKAVADAYEESGSNIQFELFQIALMASYILKMPKALISSVLSPKMIFPIAAVYKILNPNKDITVKALFQTFYKLFYGIIVQHFWVFIKEFWRFVKVDLLNFLRVTAQNILLNKIKKIKNIISSLINFLKRLIQGNIGSCQEIYNIILQTIQFTLNRSIKIPIPGLLLALADHSPGFSSDRATMGAFEKLEGLGINMGPIYGTDNKFASAVKGIIESYSEEMDQNGYVMTGTKDIIYTINTKTGLPIPMIGAKSVGKFF